MFMYIYRFCYCTAETKAKSCTITVLMDQTLITNAAEKRAQNEGYMQQEAKLDETVQESLKSGYINPLSAMK